MNEIDIVKRVNDAVKEEKEDWENRGFSKKSNESDQHKQLKILGRLILSNMGFASAKIKEEYTFPCNGHNYRVDLIASHYFSYEDILPKKEYQGAVIIEVGGSQPQKFQYIRETGATLLHLPYAQFSDRLLLSPESERNLEEIARVMNAQRILMTTWHDEILKTRGGERERYREAINGHEEFIEKLEERYETLDNSINKINKFKEALDTFLKEEK